MTVASGTPRRPRKRELDALHTPRHAPPQKNRTGRPVRRPPRLRELPRARRPFGGRRTDVPEQPGGRCRGGNSGLAAPRCPRHPLPRPCAAGGSRRVARGGRTSSDGGPDREPSLHPRTSLAMAAAASRDARYAQEVRSAVVDSFEGPKGRECSMGKKLYVGNLPFSATSEDLEALFSKVGPASRPRSSPIERRAVRAASDSSR
jgi:hypothetical protein